MNKPLKNQKTALVLGGTGTIGHQLVKRLKKEGYWVRCVDRKLNEYSESAADEMIIADLRYESAVSRVMFSPTQKLMNDGGESFDEVYMLAAEMGGASYIFSKENDADIIYNSAIMNLNVAKYASVMGVKKIFFSSSACVYSERNQGLPNSESLRESSAWDGKPDSVYGIEKLFSEDVYDSFRRNKGLNVRIARFHNIFSTECTYKGGREKAPAAVCRKVAEAKDGEEIEIWGSGIQTRSFLWIDEALDAVRRLMDSEVYEPINIGSDERISINDLAKMVIKISGKQLTIKNVDSDFIGVVGRNSDNNFIRQKLNYAPSMPLVFGMEKLYSWINKQTNL